ncbi:MAG: hypothetical protein ACK4L8_10340 [Nitrincola lacisaponensis]|uniref:hypothetical protein n=1 Tax=Nitrincola lacisaponensis TaxID=267850 RepID=UPI00391AF4E8
MTGCYSSGDFKKYFNENMKELGLPVPQTLFDSYSAAIANTGLILEAIRTLGKDATMGEVIKATTGLEKLKVAAAIGASYYVGAVIGSIAIASGRSLGCGYRISDLFVFLDQNNLKFKDWNKFYVKNPEIMDINDHSRSVYGIKARSWVYA